MGSDVQLSSILHWLRQELFPIFISLILLLPPTLVLSMKGFGEEKLKELNDALKKYSRGIIIILILIVVYLNFQIIKISIHESIPHGEYWVAINILKIKYLVCTSLCLLVLLCLNTYMHIFVRISKIVSLYLAFLWFIVTSILTAIIIK